MEIRILGPLEVSDGTRVLELGGFRQRALLARLAVAANRVVAVDALLDELWGPQAQAAARQALQAQASRLRKALGDPERLVARAPGYVLVLAPDELDAARFEALLAQARAATAEGDRHTAARRFAEAEGLWRGPALAEFADAAFAQAEAARLGELRLGAMEARMDAELDLGRHDQVVAELEALVGAHPYRERLWAQLILALYRAGRQADALAAYKRLREVLGDELGIAPRPELARLEEAVLLQRPELDWVGRADWEPQSSSSPGPPPDPPDNLPRPRSSFIGRYAEIDELDKLLQAPGLVSVVGPGGVGKTRLAVEVARQVRGRFPDGTWLVELAALSDPSLVPNAVAAAMGLVDERNRPVVETLATALVGRRTLMVLDNCEHLADAVAGVADILLASAPDLTILATSREPLRVEGEVVLRVLPLSVPPHTACLPDAALGFDAVRLFCERAEAQSGFSLDVGNVSAVIALCRALDGIPLALELASSRSEAFGPTEMLALLDDGFALLAQGRRTASPRHRTLEAAIGWSYELLTAAEQCLFRRLAVFVGGFTIEEAQAVCGDDRHPQEVLAVLATLVEKSLVTVEDGSRRRRYRLLETLRAFAGERLSEAGEDAVVQRRHLAFFLKRAQALASQIRGHEPASALGQVDEAQPNLRAAFHCGVQHDVDSALRLIAALGYYWLIRGHLPEAEQACRRALRQPAESRPELRGAALRVSGHISCASGNYAGALSDLEEARTLGRDLGDPSAVAEAVDGLAWVAFEEGRYEDAQHLNEQALAEWSKSRVDHGCVSSVAEVLHNLGILAFERGEMEAARNWFQRSLAASVNIGLTERIAPLYGLGKIARAEGRLELAKEMFTQSAAVADRVGFPRWLAFSLLFLGSIAGEQGDLDLSESRLREALVLSVRLADRICVAWCAETLAATAARRGDMRRSARLLGAAEALRGDVGAPVQPSERAAFYETVALTAAALDEEELVAEWKTGRLLSLAGILELAEPSVAPAQNRKS